MEYLFKSPGSNGKRIIFVILFSLGMLLFIGYEGHREQKIMLEHYGQEQLLLVQQAVLFSGANAGSNSVSLMWEQKMLRYLQDSTATGSRYWILSKEDRLLFLRNDSLTKQYTAKGLAGYFTAEKNADFLRRLAEEESFSAQVERAGEGELLASVKTFTAEGARYTLILCTKTSYIMSLNQMLAHQTYLMMAALLLSAVAIIVTLIFNGEISGAEEKNRALKEELQQRNLQVMALSEGQLAVFGKGEPAAMEAGEFDAAAKGASAAIGEAGTVSSENLRYRQYRLKFYLNTYHYIYIDGKPGELHPHTWQMTAQAVNQKDGIILFNEVELKIDGILERYQDQTLNDIPPFDVLNPTLENISEYFKNEFASVLNQFGWQLVRFECSETPTRAYLIDLGSSDE
ncbi:hypothetical protein FRZ06_06780 [Anoxybacterium hadale]|uniref:Uncharacterized protein n=1 Tax=Anoxybacterium hadale TaxID=3408580 RepID=A0ACD1A9V4_9FIRM|nr:hypothetical protein FRZ06_06780 [Clostridiales bacterium]